DRTSRFDEAMTQLAQAKKEARQAFNPQEQRRNLFERREKEIREARALPKNILRIWSETFAPNVRTATPPLAFLTGSARSGTTLLEKILDAHPSVSASDESFAFQKIHPQIKVSAPIIPTPELNLWRQRYVKNLMVDLEPVAEKKTLLDKNPSHTF